MTSTAIAERGLRASIASYDENAATYAAWAADKTMSTQLERFLALLPAGGRVLDAGCGPGRDMARFAAHGHPVLGVDLSTAMLALAAEHGFVIHGDLRRLPLAAASVDGVWACASVVHLDEAGTRAALAEFARVLRPGGALYLSTKHGEGSEWVDAHGVGRRWFHRWNPEALAAAAGDAGFLVAGSFLSGRFVDLFASKKAAVDSASA